MVVSVLCLAVKTTLEMQNVTDSKTRLHQYSYLFLVFAIVYL